MQLDIPQPAVVQPVTTEKGVTALGMAARGSVGQQIDQRLHYLLVSDLLLHHGGVPPELPCSRGACTRETSCVGSSLTRIVQPTYDFQAGSTWHASL